MGLNHERLALWLGGLAYQLDLITTSVVVIANVPQSSSEGEASQAFVIIAFLSFITGFVLLLEMSYADLKGNKIAKIITICLLFLGALSLIIAVAIWGSALNPGEYSAQGSYQVTAYMVASAAGIIAGIFLILNVLGK